MADEIFNTMRERQQIMPRSGTEYRTLHQEIKKQMQADKKGHGEVKNVQK